MDLFIINSFIDAPGSVYTPDERYKQTLYTIQSIRNKIPEAQIIILEVSDIMYFGDVETFKISADVAHLHKSTGEAIILTEFIESDRFREIVSTYEIKRIFKLSGRYFLNDNFYEHKYSTERITARKVDTLHDPNEKQRDGEPDWCHVTSLFSFPPRDIGFLYERLKFVLQVDYTYGSNIEHDLFYNIIGLNEIDVLGVSGNLAGSGKFISY